MGYTWFSGGDVDNIHKKADAEAGVAIVIDIVASEGWWAESWFEPTFSQSG